MTALETREVVEAHRRAKLSAQIAALRKQFSALGEPRWRHAWLQRIKLSNKIARLEAELEQPMLLPVGRAAALGADGPAWGGARRRSG